MEIEKLIEILRGKCAVCKRSSCNGKYWQLSSCPATCEAADALEQLQAENDGLKEEVQQMRWIPVEERLPEEGKRCLLYTPCDGVLCVGYYAGKDEWQHRHKWRLVTAMRSTQTLTKKVTHWTPLPEAPKEEKKND